MHPPDHVKYLRASANLRFATEGFEETMRRVLRGAPVEPRELALDATALIRLHTQWLELSLLLARSNGGLALPAGLGDDGRGLSFSAPGASLVT